MFNSQKNNKEKKKNIKKDYFFVFYFSMKNMKGNKI